ncbi:MAG: electron transport complex subunit RsxC [Eubacterium sp.]|nr:electron transport complex subunit RsxC [Eubacterium sp.]
MKRRSFKRGVHPYEGKEFSMNSAIRTVEAGDIVVYPLIQHIGAPAKAVVAVGDRVLKGQMIAKESAFVSSPIFSSVSGTVKALEKRPSANGIKIDCIVISNDHLDEAVEGFGVERSLGELSYSEIAKRVAKSGCVGLGGAGFPTSVKLTPKNIPEIDTLIINGAECEPYLTSDYRIMLERGDEIVKGIEAGLRLLPNAKAVIGIEDNKPEAIKIMSEKVAGKDRISVVPLKTKYPQGGERQLIYAVTGRKINSKMLPADKGCIVVNIASCFAIYEAIYKGMPLVHRVMTVTGEGVNSPCNLDVPIGISHAEVLEAAGGAKDGVVKFISGGPMMGTAISHLDTPVVKTSSSILAFIKDDVAAVQETACIRCGRCAGVCPQLLVPQMLARSVKNYDFERFETLGGPECMECGSCTYVCPAKIPLTQYFKFGKAKLRKIAAEKKAKEGA